MNRIYNGVKTMDRFPTAVVIIDCHYEKGAALEARAANIPVISLVDTNSDPDLVDYVIPANDDALKSLTLVLGVLADAIKKGNGGKGVKHQFKDYLNYEVQIIKKTSETNESEKSAALSTAAVKEPEIVAKPRKKSGVQKGILELVKEEAEKQEPKAKEKIKSVKKKAVTKLKPVAVKKAKTKIKAKKTK